MSAEKKMITGRTRKANMNPKLNVAVRSPNKKFIPSLPYAITLATASEIEIKIFFPNGMYRTKAPKANCKANAPPTVLKRISFLLFESKTASPMRTTMPTRLIIISIG